MMKSENCGVFIGQELGFGSIQTLVLLAISVVTVGIPVYLQDAPFGCQLFKDIDDGLSFLFQ
ncbi:hypothetical protein BAU15_04035 [Enterococcus sp. JM4C]|uniref:hypothetical protein n=1 Tax=Candidatus Enterococcus huntleyi TaxID=1857217 RepID=UPI00137A5471|nr:hypothetical protein [Enterococcus sp. JM4C]KAF1295714.1 hypothetical protein BAU15_04035 [Enterococcus sp. JM4C]